jgi:hypothetical protein
MVVGGVAVGGWEEELEVARTRNTCRACGEPGYNTATCRRPIASSQWDNSQR